MCPAVHALSSHQCSVCVWLCGSAVACQLLPEGTEIAVHHIQSQFQMFGMAGAAELVHLQADARAGSRYNAGPSDRSASLN